MSRISPSPQTVFEAAPPNRMFSPEASIKLFTSFMPVSVVELIVFAPPAMHLESVPVPMTEIK